MPVRIGRSSAARQTARLPLGLIALLLCLTSRPLAAQSADAEEPTTGGAAPAKDEHATPAPAPSDDEVTSYGAVAVVPTPGARLESRRHARNVHILDAAVLERGRPATMHDALQGRLAGVVINDVQNNPLQPDLQYRGYTASPLVGSPQGLSIYQNGVRINEPFGEVVQWDLVPLFAIDEAQLMPGSNPLYGLNSLGGSLALRLKNGFRNPGTAASALGGSFGRSHAVMEYGGSGGGWGLYAGASVFGEDGFRDVSPSRARQLSSDVRHIGETHELGINVTYADTELYGNGPVPVELLADDRSSVYTYPDITRNTLVLPALDASLDLSDALALSGTLYLRSLRRDTVNGDEGEFETCGAMGVELLCDEDGEVLETTTGVSVPAPAADTAYDALFNTSDTEALGAGGSLQLLVDRALAGHDNQLLVGASYDGAAVEFSQRAELGQLTPDRGVSRRGVSLGGDAFRTGVKIRNHHMGVYASDTFDLMRELSLTASARLNWARIEMADQLGSALDGEHDFVRVNPAAGASYTPIEPLTFFASYAEANRAPSAAELACADPDQPCRLPNAFIADPPLDQVVSRGVEVGVRGRHGPTRRPELRWSLAGHLTRNSDDILFVAGSRVGTGYFRNAGETQRLGVEADLSAQLGVLELFASYALLIATYETALQLPGHAHPESIPQGSDDDGDGEGGFIAVSPGDRIPGLPTHSARVGARVHPGERLVLGVSSRALSGQYLRGDEANLLSPLSGYVVVDANASYRLVDSLSLFIEARNVLDAEYETFGVVADPSEVIPALSTPRFVSPGPPLGIWVGVQLENR